MNQEWEERLESLLQEVRSLGGLLSDACDDFSASSALPDGEDREEAEEALDEAADCLADVENCLEEALKILKKH